MVTIRFTDFFLMQLQRKKSVFCFNVYKLKASFQDHISIAVLKKEQHSSASSLILCVELWIKNGCVIGM